jgi:hypothetical protein
MKDSEHALEHLKVIRGMMEKATIYRALSAPAAIFGGALAMLIGLYFFIQDQKEIYVSGYEFFWTWVIALVIGDSFNSFLLFRRARKEGVNFLSSGLKHTCYACAPAAIAGGIISYEVVEQEVELCALVWILCYGVAILAKMPNPIPAMNAVPLPPLPKWQRHSKGSRPMHKAQLPVRPLHKK